MRAFIRRVVRWLRRAKWEAEFAEELAFHREMKEREIAAGGTPSREVRLEATRAMGNTTLMAEEARYMLVPRWIESLRQDLVYALRSLRGNAWFTALAVIVLSMGVGVNVSYFTVFNAVALRPPAIDRPELVVALYQAAPLVRDGQDFENFPLVARDFLEAKSRTLEAVVAHRTIDVDLEDNRPLAKMRASVVSGNLFRVLGIRMALGRGFIPEEDRPGSPQAVVVLGHSTWITRYDRDPEIVGKSIKVNGVPAVVVGVTAEEFYGIRPDSIAIYIPFASLRLFRENDEFSQALLTKATVCCVSLLARLAPGADGKSAASELDLLVRAFRDTNSLEPVREGRPAALVTGARFLDNPAVRRRISPIFALLFLGFTLIVLMVCVTVSNLLLARASARSREIGIRLSLGATRSRVIRQLFTESFLLSLFGACGAIVLAYWLPEWVIHRVTSGDAGGLDFAVDWRVLAYALGLSLISCLVFGLAPALQGTKLSLAAAANPNQSGWVGGNSFRHLLMGVQVTISIVLLTGAVLLLRGVQETANRHVGFAVERLTTLTIQLPAASQDPGHLTALASTFRTKLSGVLPSQSWCLVQSAPLNGSVTFTGIRLPHDPAHSQRVTGVYTVSPGCFRILEVPILAGRDFAPEDAGQDVVIVNETMARRYWPGENPIGKTFEAAREREVIGLVKDAELTRLGNPDPLFIEPLGDRWAESVLIRNPSPHIVDHVRSIVKQLEPAAHVNVIPLREHLQRELTPLRAGASIAGSLGFFSLILASVGMVGVFGFVVERRTREIGIRMALGARSIHVVRLVSWMGGKAVIVGGAAGVLLAMALCRTLAGFLYGLSPLDPASYLSAVLVLVAAATAAAIYPVVRALRIQPTETLRHD